MPTTLRYAALTDVGRIREINEDSGYAGPYLLAVADGVGGAVAGELASALTIDTVRQLDQPAPDDPEQALAAAAAAAYTRIADRIDADPQLEGMGTTLIAALFAGDRIHVAHIGDSRAYVWRGGEVRQITHDHTYVQSLVDDGRLTREEAANHPHRSLIIKVMDGRHEATPDLFTVEVGVGDRILLCSDGLTDVLADHDVQAIGAILAEHASVDDAVAALVRLALEGGGPDNVTCVLAEVVDAAGSPAADGATGAADAAVLVGAVTEVDLDNLEHPTERTATQERADDEDGPAGVRSVDGDDEELRYAPRPPHRFRWLRRAVVGVVALAVLVAGGWAAYTWTQRQYFVGPYVESPGGDGGEPQATESAQVAIYRGIAQRVPGLQLADAFDVRRLRLGALPAYHRQLVEDTISAGSLDDAEEIVDRLEQVARTCADAATSRPDPAPRTPTPTRPGETTTPASPRATDTDPTAGPDGAAAAPSAGQTSPSRELTAAEEEADDTGTARADGAPGIPLECESVGAGASEDNP